MPLTPRSGATPPCCPRLRHGGLFIGGAAPGILLLRQPAADPAHHSYMAPTTQALWSEGGWARFYRGFTPCLMRAVPANAAMLTTVDAVQNLLH